MTRLFLQQLTDNQITEVLKSALMIGCLLLFVPFGNISFIQRITICDEGLQKIRHNIKTNYLLFSYSLFQALKISRTGVICHPCNSYMIISFLTVLLKT